jgi:hypothetical protein
VFEVNDKGFKASLVGRSPTSADISIIVLDSGGLVVQADCMQARANFIEAELIFDTSDFCILAFKLSLLGYWSKGEVSFKWDAAGLSLEPTFALAPFLTFNPDPTRGQAVQYDLIWFLV